MSFTPSVFITSLLHENEEHISQQLRFWDSSSLWKKINKHKAVKTIKTKTFKGVLSVSGWATEKIKTHKVGELQFPEQLSQARNWLEEQLSPPPEDKLPDFFAVLNDETDYRTARLCRFLKAIGEDISAPLSVVQLHELGNAVEREALQVLTSDKKADFHGNSVEDLTQHVVGKLFKDLSEKYKTMAPNDRSRVVEGITHSFDTLDDAAKEKLRSELQSEDITNEVVHKAIMSGGIAGSVAALVGLSGFAAYTTITTALSFISFGLLPFPAYTFATSAVAGVAATAPLMPIALAGAAIWFYPSENIKNYKAMLPMFVALTVLSSKDQSRNYDAESQWVERINQHLLGMPKSYENFELLKKAYPCLIQPSEKEKWTSKIFSKLK